MRPTSFRLGALLAVGVLIVHELRYRVLDAQAGVAAAEAGHGYLGALTASVGVVLVLALGRTLHLWATCRADQRSSARSPLALWLLTSGAVLAGYVGQELVAGWLSAGHPAGLTGLFAHGGWIAIPLSLACGAVISAVVRTAARLLRHCMRAAFSELICPLIPGSRLHLVDVANGRLMARYLAGRSPPAALSR